MTARLRAEPDASEPGAAASAAPRAEPVAAMADRWLLWVAAAAVLGVFVPPLVSEPSPPLVSAPSVKTSSAALSETHVSELIEPPAMTELAGSTSRFFEPPPAGNEEAKPQAQIAVRLPSPSAARNHSLRRSASRHVAFNYRMHRRICCIPPVVDKAGY
jgi:hypothetical protein